LKTMVPKISDNLLIKSLYTLLVKISIVAKGRFWHGE